MKLPFINGLALLLIVAAFPLNGAEDTPQAFHNLSLKIPKKVRGIVYLKLPKSEVKNCGTSDILLRQRVTGAITVDTSVLGAPYATSLSIPIGEKLIESKVHPGRKQFTRVKLLLREGDKPAVVFQGFSIKDEKAKCD